MSGSIKVGLIGFGTVGSGFVKLLEENSARIAKELGERIEIVSIVDKDVSSPRGVGIESGVLTTDVKTILENPEVDIVVELIGGCEPARSYILQAIESGKGIVTANKALLAESGWEIFSLARQKKVDVYFEASVGSCIPIIKFLRESATGNHITSIMGIINGTSNYILSEMDLKGKSFDEVLREAQERGYAERDPSMDVDGIDSSHKLAILASLAFKTKVELKNIYTEGIRRISPQDVQHAKEFGYTIKLLAIAKDIQDGMVSLRVHPTMIPRSHLLSSVSGIFNACYVTGDAMGEVLLHGRGAGGMAAASAVVGDVIDLARNLKNKVSGRVPAISPALEKKKAIEMGEIISRYYIRFTVVDRPGVLANISAILGKNGISIASVIQKERREGDTVPIVMLTHEAVEGKVSNAIKKIDQLPAVKAESLVIRVEEM